MKSHLETYPTPISINYYWNIGFLLGITILLQIFTGILLALHYSSDLNSSYFSIFFLIREIYYGWSLRYLHSSTASFVFLFIFLHLSKAFYYTSYYYNPNTWFTGILILFFLMAIAFMGYVLPFGQMSFWGATVITNLLSPFPSLIEYICGGYYINNPTLHRFFIFHFILPFLLLILIIIHIFYLHFNSSNNPLTTTSNNKIPFYPYILLKDFYSLLIFFILLTLQSYFGISSLSHPDNALQANPLNTPLHIVPEWYFLCQYALLKAVPNKNAGFIILLTSITFLLTLSFTTTSYTTTTSYSNTIYTSKLYIFFYFILIINLFYIGIQFPQTLFISYARILSLYYYFFLISILLSLLPKVKVYTLYPLPLPFTLLPKVKAYTLIPFTQSFYRR